MDGVHDLGGTHGFGAVPVEDVEPYHEAWELRVAVMAGTVMRHTTIDRFRSTIEQMPPAEYLSSAYFERWLWALERLADEQGLLDGSGNPEPEPQPTGDAATARWYADGDRVRVGRPTTKQHTRVPRYVRGQVGTVVRRGCAWSHPTASAATGRHGELEHIYTVAFAASDLFGPEADHVLYVDLWESDLEEAT